jgi:hypothetical protein
MGLKKICHRVKTGWLASDSGGVGGFEPIAEED